MVLLLFFQIQGNQSIIQTKKVKMWMALKTSDIFLRED